MVFRDSLAQRTWERWLDLKPPDRPRPQKRRRTRQDNLKRATAASCEFVSHSHVHAADGPSAPHSTCVHRSCKATVAVWRRRCPSASRSRGVRSWHVQPHGRPECAIARRVQHTLTSRIPQLRGQNQEIRFLRRNCQVRAPRRVAATCTLIRFAFVSARSPDTLISKHDTCSFISLRAGITRTKTT